MPLFCFDHYFMIVKELFGTQIINASFLNANSNIWVKYYSEDFPSVQFLNFLRRPISFLIFFTISSQCGDMKIVTVVLYRNITIRK